MLERYLFQPPGRINPFLELERLINKSIKSKYEKGPGPQEDARRDALAFCAIALAYFQYESVFPAKGDKEDEDWDREYARRRVTMWSAASEKAINGDWEGIKNELQSYARSAFQSAGERDSLGQALKLNLESAASESEKRGLAFANLANSVI